MAKPGDLLGAALELARLGYSVFPCLPGEKRPAVEGGFYAATRDPAALRRWWSRWPKANVAIACRDVVVIDVDPAGRGWPPRPEQRASIRGTGCPLVRTPRGGWHIWFRLPPGKVWRCSTGRLASGVDVRTCGGYVLVPPSRTGVGHYRWVRPLVPPERLPLPPEWLVKALDQLHRPGRPASANGTRDPVADAPVVLREGERNCGLASFAGRLRRAGATQDELEAALLAFNVARCDPPLSEKEVLGIARSIARYPPSESLPPAMQRAWRKAIAHKRRRRVTHGWSAFSSSSGKR